MLKPSEVYGVLGTHWRCARCRQLWPRRTHPVVLEDRIYCVHCVEVMELAAGTHARLLPLTDDHILGWVVLDDGAVFRLGSGEAILVERFPSGERQAAWDDVYIRDAFPPVVARI